MKKLVSKLSNSPKGGLTVKRSYRWLAIGLIALAVSALALPGCKAWRTVTTSATYVQSDDSTKVTTTISTKTVEEYQGVKKNR